MLQGLTHRHHGSWRLDRITKYRLEQIGLAAVRRWIITDVVSRKNEPTASATRLVDGTDNRLGIVATLFNEEGT